jgi:ATP-dependent Clp protease ATP-binding subunit ClpC
VASDIHPDARISRALSDRAKRALALGGAEAIRLGQPAVRPEDLLVGLLACGDTMGAQALMSSGLDLRKARATVEGLTAVPPNVQEVEGIWPAPETREIMRLAADQADRMGSREVGPEHLLLALLAAPGSAAGVFQAVGLSAEAIRRSIVDGKESGS